MRILVLGATGTVGSQVAGGLIAAGHEVHGLTRGGKGLPEGVHPLQGDLLDVATVRSAFRGMDAAFLLNAWSTTEAHEGLQAVNGCMDAHVGRVVYLSVHDTDKAAFLPHFGAKVAVERALENSGLAYTILRPNNFFQNDFWYKDALLQYGVYPQPIGSTGLSRVDVRDIADAAVVALTQDGHAGKTYVIAGDEAVTGESTAAVWSRVLGREIRYGGDDIAAWTQQNLSYGMPPLMVDDFARMYDWFQRHGLVATAADVATMTQLLGHAPRRFADFAAEAARAWGVAPPLPA